MSSRKPNQESPIAFRGWALMLGNASQLLEGLRRQYSLPGNRESGRVTKQAACGCGATILRALSVELALKFLAYLRTGRHAFGHDLWKLYLDLDEQTRAIVQAVDRRSNTESRFPPCQRDPQGEPRRLRLLPVSQDPDDGTVLAGPGESPQRPRGGHRRFGFSPTLSRDDRDGRPRRGVGIPIADIRTGGSCTARLRACNRTPLPRSRVAGSHYLPGLRQIPAISAAPSRCGS